MSKRLMSLLLCGVLLLGLFPVPVARAVDGAEAAYINVNLAGYEQRIQVFTWEEDLLFSARDLANLSGFRLDSTADAVNFTRGCKVIRVERESGKLTCSVSTGSKILKSPVLTIGGDVYLSGAEMLPWLNVGMTFQNGMIYMVPNPVSLWDFAGDLNIKDYGFSAEKCQQIMGISSKELNAIIYMERNDSVIFSMLNLEDFYSTKQYYELFDDFFLDKSGAEAAAEEISEDVEATAEFISSVGQMLDVLLPGMGEALETVSNIGKGMVRLMTWCYVFSADNTNQLAIMRSIKNCRNYQYDQNMLDAVDQIIDTYTDEWKGLNYQTAYDLVQCEVENMEKLTGKDLYRAFKKNWTDDSIDNTWLKRFSCYRSLSGVGLQVYRKGWGSGNSKDMENYMCHAMLYLYASEQCYRGIIQYIFDNGNEQGYTRDMAVELLRLADRNDKLYGKFLAASMYIKYDNVNFKAHSDDYEELVQSFAGLELHQGEYGIARTAEMAVYMAALMDMNIPGLGWTMEDVDRDGAYEYVVEGMFQEYNPLEPSFMVLDGMNMGIFTPMGAAGSAVLTHSRDGACYYVRYSYSSAMNQAQTIFGWNGGRWSPVVGSQTTVVESEGEFINEDTWEVNGREATREEYFRALGDLELMDSDALSGGDPLDQWVPGTAEGNFEVLDEYYENRDGFQQVLEVDLDQDGDMDRVYAILRAADLWKNNAAMDECGGEEIPFLFRDSALTLVAAENQGDSVRLRVSRIPSDGTVSPVSIVEGQLLYQGSFYTYQEAGALFQAEGVPGMGKASLADMAGMPFSVIRDQSWDEFWTYESPDSPEEWTANAWRGDCSYTFYFSESMKEDPNDSPYLITVVYYGAGVSQEEVGDGVMLGMTYGQVQALAAVSDLQVTQLAWIAEYYPGGYNTLLQFNGDNAEAVLFGAEIYIFD